MFGLGLGLKTYAILGLIALGLITFSAYSMKVYQAGVHAKEVQVLRESIATLQETVKKRDETIKKDQELYAQQDAEKDKLNEKVEELLNAIKDGDNLCLSPDDVDGLRKLWDDKN